MKKFLPIVYICDDAYIVPTIVSIQSLCMNKKEETCYVIHIITAALNDENKLLFKQFESETIQIKMIEVDISKYQNMHTYQKNSYCVATPAALLKFDIPILMPEYEEVLYMDGDIIIQKDMSFIFKTSLGENYVAAVLDSGNLYTQNKTKLKYQQYFNSGVMFLNTKQMRKDNITEKLIAAKTVSTDMSLMDQNIFNQLFEGRIILLPFNCNVLYINLMRAKQAKKVNLATINQCNNTNYKSFKQILKDAVVIHYSSKDKPWKFTNVPSGSIWDFYFKMSPLGKMKLKREKTRLKPPTTNKFLLLIQALQKNGIKKSFIKAWEHLEKCHEKWWERVLWKVMGFLRFVYLQVRFLYYKTPFFAGLNKREKREREIIVSLTTIPYRINAVPIVVGTLMRQTKRPDRIQVYLGQKEFENIELPFWLKLWEKKGLEIIYCQDLKPHTKYYYALKANPEAIIITVDDDIFYHKDIVEILYKSYKNYPHCVSALRTHLITFDKKSGEINPYNVWRQRWDGLTDVPHMRLFATGVGGVLYPPHIFPEEIFNKEVFMELCPCQDDLWLKIMEVMNGVPCVMTGKKRDLRYIDNTQEVALLKKNVGHSANDVHLIQILERYNETFGKQDTLLERMKSDPTPIRNSLLK